MRSLCWPFLNVIFLNEYISCLYIEYAESPFCTVCAYLRLFLTESFIYTRKFDSFDRFLY